MISSNSNVSKNLTISEASLILLGIVIKLIIRSYVNINSLSSLSYSSTDSWETILEYNALQNAKLPIYDGDTIHQPPLIIILWKLFLKLTLNSEFCCFCIFDILCLLTTLKLANRIILIFVQEQNKVKERDKYLAIDMKNLGKIRFMLCLWHIFNPFLNISILSQSITCFNNLMFLLMFLNIVKEKYIWATIYCAIFTYSKMYPIVFLFVLLIAAAQKKKSCLEILIVFVGVLSLLIGVSISLAGDKFLSNVYWHHFSMNDVNPQLNLYWYMMATMFDHFRSFFQCTFQLILITVCGGLAAKYKEDLVFLTYVLHWTVSVLKPYPSIGETGQILALLPIYRHLFPYLKFGVVTCVMLVCVLVLGPLMHYLWMINGTANANFYFAITLVYCAAQSHLVSAVLSAYLKYDFYLQHGRDVKLSDGSDVQLRAK